MKEFQVSRQSLTEHRIVETESDPLADGEIRMAIDRFAFTSNNITYGVAGDMLGYWQFFPAAQGDADTWGVLPVWGFADVADSRCEGIAVGERFYGYFPPATELKMVPGNIKPMSFAESAPHRASLPPAYNRYRRVSNDPGYDSRLDELQALLFPLYVTSYCLWDSLQDNHWHGAQQAVVLSASSKTSIGLAYALSADDNAPEVVGITSVRNAETVQNIDLYDRVISYDDITTLPDVPTVIVDMSGNSAVLGQLHQHLGEHMCKTLNVGITHWTQPRSSDGINTERSEMFFAPGHIQKRYKDWGADGFERRSSEFLQAAIADSLSWLQITKLQGLDGLASVYRDVCKGKVAADAGLIITMRR
jgi:hypothetical protein